MNDIRPSVIKNNLFEAIENKENTTKENLSLADKINFNPIDNKIILTDQYGFIKKEEEKKEPMSQKEIEQLNEEIEQWNEMLTQFDIFSTSKLSKLKARNRKGVPEPLRGVAWKKYAGINQYIVPGLFSSLVNQKEGVNEDVESIILKDLDRTFPSNLHFTSKYGEGQRSLYHVLSAYARYNKDTEYVQGMGFIAALLLSYMDEESAFYTLHSIMKKYGLEGLYLPGFPDLKKKSYVLLCLMKKHIPKVYQTLYRNEIMPTLYASEWFITLFTRQLDFSILVRIFDCFLLEGFKVIYRFSLAFLKMRQDNIVSAGNEMADVMNEVKMVFDDIDIKKLFEEAFKFSISRAYIRKCEEDYERYKDDKTNEITYLL